MKYILLSLVIGLQVLSQETQQSYISPCFNSKPYAKAVLKKIQFLKTNKYKLRIDNNCIEILTSTKREELYKKYLRSNFEISHYKNIQDFHDTKKFVAPSDGMKNSFSG